MKRLPVFLDMSNKKALVVGGGKAAFIKIKNMLLFDIDITVISRDFLEDIKYIKNIKCIKKNFECSDVLGFYIVIAAVNDELNQIIYNTAKKNNILCCATGRGFKGDFIFPSCYKNDELTVAVSTNGAYPLLAKKICGNISSDLSEKISFLRDIRIFVLDTFNKNLQNKILNELIEDSIIFSENYKEKIYEIIKRYKNE